MNYLVKYTKRHGHSENNNPRVKFYYRSDAQTVFFCAEPDLTRRIKWMRKELLREFKLSLKKEHGDDYYKLCNINIIIYSTEELGEGDLH